MTARSILLLLALAASGCASHPDAAAGDGEAGAAAPAEGANGLEPWEGRYAPLDGAWTVAPDSRPLLTLDHVSAGPGERVASGSITDRVGKVMPVTLHGDDDALSAEAVEHEGVLELPVQGIAAGGGAVRVTLGKAKLEGPVRIGLRRGHHEGTFVLVVASVADPDDKVELHLAKPSGAAPR